MQVSELSESGNYQIEGNYPSRRIIRIEQELETANYWKGRTNMVGEL